MYAAEGNGRARGGILTEEDEDVDSMVIFLMIRRGARSTQRGSSAASDVYKWQFVFCTRASLVKTTEFKTEVQITLGYHLSLIHISEPTRLR